MFPNACGVSWFSNQNFFFAFVWIRFLVNPFTILWLFQLFNFGWFRHGGSFQCIYAMRQKCFKYFSVPIEICSGFLVQKIPICIMYRQIHIESRMRPILEPMAKLAKDENMQTNAFKINNKQFSIASFFYLHWIDRKIGEHRKFFANTKISATRYAFSNACRWTFCWCKM